MIRILRFFIISFVLLSSQQALSQEWTTYIGKDTLIVDTAFSQITTIKFNGMGYGGGRTGGSPRVRFASYSVKDSAGRVNYCGFFYDLQVRCTGQSPYSIHFKYHEDNSYEILTIKERTFSTLYITEYHNEWGRRIKRKKSRKLPEDDAKRLRKLQFMRCS